MTMAFNIEKLRETGDPKDEARAAMIQSILDDRGEDIPLPSAETPAEPTFENTARLKLARYSLHDSADPKQIDIIDGDDIERRLALDAAFTVITEPYFFAAKSKLPLMSETKKKGTSAIDWHSELELELEPGKRIIHSAYRLTFSNDGYANKAENLEVKFGYAKKPHRSDSFIRLTFDDNGVSEITFKEEGVNGSSGTSLLTEILEHNAGAEKVNMYRGKNTQMYSVSPREAYTVNLRETPLAITSKSRWHNSKKVFNPKTGKFISSEVRNNDLILRNSKNDVVINHNDLEPEYVLDFYSDLLNLIPLKQTEI